MSNQKNMFEYKIDVLNTYLLKIPFLINKLKIKMNSNKYTQHYLGT